jgi:hypothetical protein
MAPNSSSCVSLSSEIDVMEFASGDDHKWRQKCEELKEDKEAMTLMRLLVAQEDDLQDKLMERSKVKLTQGIISLFTYLCAYGEMNAELNNSPLPCKSYDALCAEMRSYNMKLVEHDAMRANLEKENELLRSTYAKCIEEEINNWRNMACGTFAHLMS